MTDKYLILTFELITKQLYQLATQIENSFRPEILVGISRGGLVVTRLLSDILQIKEVKIIGVGFYTDINETAKKPVLLQELSDDITSKKILLIDDVADSGKSLEFAVKYLQTKGVKELKTATIHYKPHSIFRPDYFVEETEKWIVYPWEQVEFVKLYYNRKSEAGLTHFEIIEELKTLTLPEIIIQRLLSEKKMD